MPGRRPLVALVALCVVPLPACLHVAAQTTTPEDLKVKAVANVVPTVPTARAAEPTPPRMEFATLPRVPGTVVLTKPNAKPTPNATAQNQKPNTLPAGGPTQPGPVQPPGNAAPPGPFPPIAGPVPEPPLLAAVRAYAENRPDKAIEALRGLDKPNQELVLALLPVLARGASADLNNDPATVAALVDQLHGAAARLEPKAALRIEKVAFCNDVSGFGRYVPRPAEAPYRPNAQAQLYLEMRNLGSQVTGDGYLTHVHATVEVRDAHQKLVEQIDPDDYRRRVPVVRFEKRLVSRSPLHDFHVLYIFSAPPTPGVYEITVELRDATGRRVVKTRPAQFCVAGP